MATLAGCQLILISKTFISPIGCQHRDILTGLLFANIFVVIGSEAVLLFTSILYLLESDKVEAPISFSSCMRRRRL